VNQELLKRIPVPVIVIAGIIAFIIIANSPWLIFIIALAVVMYIAFQSQKTHSGDEKPVSISSFLEKKISPYTESIELHLPFDKTFDICTESVECLNWGKISRTDRPAGKIYGYIGVESKSAVERIEYRVIIIHENVSKVDITLYFRKMMILPDDNIRKNEMSKVIGTIQVLASSERDTPPVSERKKKSDYAFEIDQ
jgi:hypothetical protein